MDNYSPQEIIKIAVNVENNGIKLYGELEKTTQDEKVKKVWGYLKSQEERHKRVFEKLAQDLPASFVYEVKKGEYEAYMRAIASNYVFTQQVTEEKDGKSFLSDIEAVDFGIYIEKESILTYSALREYMDISLAETLGNIINEEKKHFIDLVLLRRELEKGG